LSSLYLAATSLKEGPITFLSTAWHAMQFFDCASCRSARAGAAKPADSDKNNSDFFMGLSAVGAALQLARAGRAILGRAATRRRTRNRRVEQCGSWAWACWAWR